MKRILVVANETVAGKPLIDAVRDRAAGEEVDVHVICPQNQPRHGYVIYESMVRDAAENRLQMTMALLREAGIEAHGEVMDPDPYAAIMDALGEQEYDEIIISTHPETRSGWLREGLVDRVRRAARRPVEHVVVDLDAERDDVKRTLVVANQTVASDELLDVLRRKAEEEPRPFIAIQNALQFYAPDDIVISTFPETRSGWLRSDLIERVQAASGKPVEHVVSEEAS